MTNYNIHSFIKTQLLYAEQMPSDAELFKHNAYGAVSWELYRANDQTLEEQWKMYMLPSSTPSSEITISDKKGLTKALSRDIIHIQSRKR